MSFAWSRWLKQTYSYSDVSGVEELSEKEFTRHVYVNIYSISFRC